MNKRILALITFLLAACGGNGDVARLTRSAVVEPPAVTRAPEAPLPETPVAPPEAPGAIAASTPRPARSVRQVSARPGWHTIGDIEIPRIGMRQPVYEGISLGTLRYGPGHWPGTAMPGHLGNAVIAGHRITNTRPFFDIDQLAPGDPIFIDTPGGRFVYEMTDHLVVRPHETWIAGNTEGATLTLFACHPKGSKSYRYVVRARLTTTPLPRAESSAAAPEAQSLPGDSPSAEPSPASPSAPDGSSEAPPPEAPPPEQSSRCRTVVCLPRRS